MKESQEQRLGVESTSEYIHSDIELSRENHFESAYQNMYLEEKTLAKQSKPLREGARWSRTQASNELGELGISHDVYQYELSKDNVMRDLEKDIQKRRQEKLVYACSMAGITIFLLLLPLFFRQKEERLPLSSADQFSNSSFTSSTSSSSSSAFSMGSSVSQSTASVASETRPSSSVVHEPRFSDKEFMVQVSVTDLNIRSEPQDTSDIVGNCPPGTYTIVEVHQNNGYTWGRLKSGEGWIALDYTDYMNARGKIKVDTKKLTTQQVKNWVRAAYEQFVAPYANIGSIRDIDVRKEKDGLVYARVYENRHQAELLFRISADGYLERQLADGEWTILSREYFE